jgi:hypothetical protein
LGKVLDVDADKHDLMLAGIGAVIVVGGVPERFSVVGLIDVAETEAAMLVRGSFSV